MKPIKLFALPVFFCGLFIVSTFPFQSCEKDKDDNKNVCDTCIIECDTCLQVYKPNIYIYPTGMTQLEVNLDFPMGGQITESIPEYNTGWTVTVDTTGLIDNEYNYLFYESIQPNIWQQTEGWIIRKDSLEIFFTGNLTNFGFRGREIQDFIDYWIPRFVDYEFYLIYPQNKMIIDNVIKLSFSKEPANVLRLFYLVAGYNIKPNIKLTLPEMNTHFERKGFFVTEWGVILK